MSALGARLDGTSVAVVGAGVGGLATATYLADAGAEVTILEQNDQPGGRASVLEREGFRWDMGPSWYLMPDVFERYFSQFGHGPGDFYDLTHLDPHYRIFYTDGDDAAVADGGSAEHSGPSGGTSNGALPEDGPAVDARANAAVGGGEPPAVRLGAPAVASGDEAAALTAAGADVLDVTGDVDRMAALFDRYEDGAGEALRTYLADAGEAYEIGMEQFVYEDRPHFRDYLDWDVVRHAHGLGLLGSMDDHVSGYFSRRELRQLVQYSLVFLGGSPRNTPALYKLMSHVDFGLGVHYPDGGLASVVEALVSLARDRGVTIETGVSVTAIRRSAGPDGRPVSRVASGTAWLPDWIPNGLRPGRLLGGESRGDPGSLTVETSDGQREVDVVVSDADYAHTERELLRPADRDHGDDYWSERTYAPSAYLLYLGVEGDVAPLAHHSLVLPENWDDHFATIFDDPRWPENPAYYCCVPSITDDSVAPAGHSTLFLLVPVAPGLDDDPDARAEMRDLLLASLADQAGVDVRDRIVVEEDFAIEDFAARYNATQGTALGLAHTLWQTGPLRPDHRSSSLPGLYYTGGYTRPGIGVPMCLIAGEHAARKVATDRGTGASEG